MSGWTREREDMLAAWVAEGLTYRLIAGRFAEHGFSVSRNAVIGKAQRMGLTSFVPPGSRRAPATFAPRKPPVAKVSAKPAAPPSPPRAEPEPIRAPASPAPVRHLSAVAAHPRLLWLIPPGGCHFPVAGEGAQTLFCADPAREGRPYCAHHHHIAHAPVTAPVRGFHDPSTVRARRSDAQGDVVDEMEAAA
ncbi:MAG: GcrA family cell cycle regulator [Pseudomonadota bacterium]